MEQSGICGDTGLLSQRQAGGGDRAICPLFLPFPVCHQFPTKSPSDSSLIVTILGNKVYDREANKINQWTLKSFAERKKDSETGTGGTIRARRRWQRDPPKVLIPALRIPFGILVLRNTFCMCATSHKQTYASAAAAGGKGGEVSGLPLTRKVAI